MDTVGRRENRKSAHQRRGRGRGPAARGQRSVSLLPGAPVSSYHLIRHLHLPRISMLTVPPVPNPSPPTATKSPPHDTQTGAARRTARRNASHVPRWECKTSCAQRHLRAAAAAAAAAHLACRCCDGEGRRRRRSKKR